MTTRKGSKEGEYSFSIQEENFEKTFKKLAEKAGSIKVEVSYSILGDSNEVRLTLKCESETEKLQIEKILQEGKEVV